MSLHLVSAKTPASGAFEAADGSRVYLRVEYEMVDRGLATTLDLPVKLALTDKGVVASMTLEVPTQKDVPAAFDKLAEWLDRAARGIRSAKLDEALSLPVGMKGT